MAIGLSAAADSGEPTSHGSRGAISGCEPEPVVQWSPSQAGIWWVARSRAGSASGRYLSSVCHGAPEDFVPLRFAYGHKVVSPGEVCALSVCRGPAGAEGAV